VEVNTPASDAPRNELYSLGHTSIIWEKIIKYAKNYPDSQFIQNGFELGFNLQYQGFRAFRESKRGIFRRSWIN
jgi:hypothetical protein